MFSEDVEASEHSDLTDGEPTEPTTEPTLLCVCEPLELTLGELKETKTCNLNVSCNRPIMRDKPA